MTSAAHPPPHPALVAGRCAYLPDRVMSTARKDDSVPGPVPSRWTFHPHREGMREMEHRDEALSLTADHWNYHVSNVLHHCGDLLAQLHGTGFVGVTAFMRKASELDDRDVATLLATLVNTLHADGTTPDEIKNVILRQQIDSAF